VRKLLRGLAWIVVVLVMARVAAAFVWPTINDVATGKTPQYADLQPQRFAQPYDRVYDAALASARALGWNVTREDRAGGTIDAVATTRVFRFRDDVTVTIARDGADAAIVNVRSHSRVGKGDLGTNARRIRTFQADLARRLS
jgi:uncharacterized protein (DUF1499 family)